MFSMCDQSCTKRFVNQCKWKEINYSSEAKDRKNFERNNSKFVLFILSAKSHKRQIRQA